MQSETKRYAGKAIITCAVTGAIHTPTMSPHLPYTPADIAEEAIAAAEAGASILHLHARELQTGRPASAPELYRQFLSRVASGTDAVVNITTGGGLGMNLDSRLAAALDLQPEMCSINMGSINFGLFPMAQKHSARKYDWERPYLESTSDFVLKTHSRILSVSYCDWAAITVSVSNSSVTMWATYTTWRVSSNAVSPSHRFSFSAFWGSWVELALSLKTWAS